MSQENIMDIPVNVDVLCQSKVCGHTVSVVLNPVTEVVTHFVVKEKETPHVQRLVPINEIFESTPHAVHLRCDIDALHKMKPFVEVEYIRSNVPLYIVTSDLYSMRPVVIPDERKDVAIKHHSVPPHELSISRGTHVDSADKYHVGNVDEFLVDQASGCITHLIMREGHLWGQKDVTLPVGEIERIEENHIYLKLDKNKVGELPAISVQRKWA